MASSESDQASTAMFLSCTALVMLMLPGLAFFYSGLAQSKSALSLLFVAMLVSALALIQWTAVGYSLVFSEGNPFIGGFHYGMFLNVDTQHPTIATLPNIVFGTFQATFAIITPAIFIGSAAGRFRILPLMLYSVIWMVLVYDVIAHWVWGPGGFLRALGAIDYAGGMPVHIVCGFSGLALTMYLGKRVDFDETTKESNFSVSNVVIGTLMLFTGWVGFNGSSVGSASPLSMLAVMNTLVAGSVGAVTWLILDLVIRRHLSCLGFCTGLIGGLVAITPGCGSLTPGFTIPLTIFTTLPVYVFSTYKRSIGLDDALDVFAVHGVGGFVGTILTGIFATGGPIDAHLGRLAGTTKLGLVDGNGMLLLYQLAGAFATAAWATAISFGLAFIFDKLKFPVRVDRETEKLGLDQGELGEFVFDYVQTAVKNAGLQF